VALELSPCLETCSFSGCCVLLLFIGMNPFKIRLGISALLHFEVHADLQSTADCDLRRVAASIRRYGCSL